MNGTRLGAAAAIAAVVFAIVLAACSGTGPTVSSSRPVTTPHPSLRLSSPRSCELRASDLLAPAQVQAYQRYVNFPEMDLPVRSLTPRDFWFQRKFTCGRYAGYVTTLALTGRYRRQNDAWARSQGLQIMKWPYTPLSGQIVSQWPHRVLEIYEGVYQFRLPAAATAYFNFVKNGDTEQYHPVRVRQAGIAVAQTFIQGAGGPNEHVLRVVAHLGYVEITASIQGGQNLSWSDVEPFWNKIWRRLMSLPKNVTT